MTPNADTPAKVGPVVRPYRKTQSPACSRHRGIIPLNLPEPVPAGNSVDGLLRFMAKQQNGYEKCGRVLKNEVPDAAT